MEAVVLCAGYATRMGALTERFPKALLPVVGRPILEDLVRQLEATGRIARIVVVANHRDFAHFASWRAGRRPTTERAVAIELVDDGTVDNAHRLGAVGDLALAVERAGLVAPLLVAAGDNLFRIDLASFLADFERDETSMVLLAHESDPARLARSGVAEVDATGRLLRLWEKPEHPPSTDCCPPLYLLTADAIAQLDPFRRAHPEADAPGHLIAWLAQHAVVRTHRMRGARLDVGDAESYRAAEAWLLARSPSVTPPNDRARAGVEAKGPPIVRR